MPSQPEATDEAATTAIRGANPFVGLSARQVAAAAGRWAGGLARHPVGLGSKVAELATEQWRIAAGAGPAIDPKDRRFSDPAWEHPLWRRVAQSYLATRASLLASADEIGLDDKSADRARFALMQALEAAAPTNNLLGNPGALKRAAATRGRSLTDGGRHFLHDLLRNGGLPSQVDTRPFALGVNMAATPGDVVHEGELFELLEYRPTTRKVRRRPLLIVPPQVNRYYFLDLAPGRSFVEHAVAQGLQVFLMSWRNPTPDERNWSLDSYVAACLEAVDLAREISGSPDSNITAFCAGGLTVSLLLGHLAATASEAVHAVALGVTGVDTDAKSTLNLFASQRSVASSAARSRRKGVLSGRSMSRTFAWMRPNDLIWNYWVNNYLMGLNPPAFDVLAWNSDATNLPATAHAEFLQFFLDNGLRYPGRSHALGSPVDLSQAKNDMYIVGALTDHLIPWQSTYMATQIFGGECRFVLSNSGHIQALVNPPGNPKASFFAHDQYPPDPEAWREQAQRFSGSWWTDWAEWILPRSGDERPARRKTGSRQHPPLCAAPGRFVHQK